MADNSNADFSLKETCPNIGAGRGISGGSAGERLTSPFDLVERMHFLYVRILRARGLPNCDSFIEVTIGSYKGRTKQNPNQSPNPEFLEVFAFTNDRLQGNILEVIVRTNDEILGKCKFDVAEVPTRVPPDSPLAPQWYRLEDINGNKINGEIMLSVWIGTQADEVFPEAWHSDSATITGENMVNTRSKVYLSPRLWYLRVNIIEAQDLVPLHRNRTNPELFIKGYLGNVVIRSRFSQVRSLNPIWNEDMMFVAVEPFEETLVLTVEDKIGNKEECLGKCEIRLSQVERRILPGTVAALWYNIEQVEAGQTVRFAGRIHLRVSLDGGYHVLDESIQYSSDYRASAKLLWPPAIGVLELGILSASGLMPMKSRDGRGTTDAYCVAKYGQKWVRTRTIFDSFSPKWNEQYTWEVYDPYTVITIGVFDNLHLLPARGSEIRWSEENGRDSARGQIHTLCMRLGLNEPPLGKEVVEYMLDVGSNMWSLRRGRANFERLLSFFNLLIITYRWFDEICKWKNPMKTLLTHSAVLMITFLPKFFIATILLYCIVIGLYRYHLRPRHPLHMDIRLSKADSALPDELDEEFDAFPTTKSGDVLKKRYDRLRGIAGRMMMVLGDLATQGERVGNLLSWRDPRATVLFLVFCSVACAIIYMVPMNLLLASFGFYVMRHPRLRIINIPSTPQNFFRRLPSRAESML